MTTKEKEYCCTKVCRYAGLRADQRDMFCAKCYLNKSAAEKKKEYLHEYYQKKIKPAKEAKR